MRKGLYKLSTLSIFIIILLAGFFTYTGESQSASFHLNQLVDGDWEEQYVQSYTVEYETHDFTFTPQDGELLLRIDQQDVSYADIEHLDLQACGESVEPEYARFTDNEESVDG